MSKILSANTAKAKLIYVKNKETYKIVRRGGEWKTLIDNLNFISKFYNYTKIHSVNNLFKNV